MFKLSPILLFHSGLHLCISIFTQDSNLKKLMQPLPLLLLLLLLLLLSALLYIHCQLRFDAKRVVVVWMLLTTVILLFRMPRCYEQQLLLVLLLAAFMLLLSTAIFVLKLLVVSLTVDCLCKFMVLFTCSR